LSKHKTFVAHFNLFSGTPACRGTQFGIRWSIWTNRTDGLRNISECYYAGVYPHWAIGPFLDYVVDEQPQNFYLL